MTYYYHLLIKNIRLNITFRMTNLRKLGTIVSKSHPTLTLSFDILNKIISFGGHSISFVNKYFFRRYLIQEYTKIITDKGLKGIDPNPGKLKYIVRMLINLDVHEIYQSELYPGISHPWVIVKQIRNSYNTGTVGVILSRIRDKSRRCLVCGSRKSLLRKSLMCTKHKGFVECEYEGCKAKTVCRGGDKTQTVVVINTFTSANNVFLGIRH